MSSIVCSALTLALAAASGASPPSLAGTFQSPLGRLAVKEAGSTVTGTILDEKNACAFKKGTVVLQGNRLNDSVVGTFTACKVSGPEGCGGPIDGAAMLLITRQGKRITGAIHLDAGACKTPVSDDGLVLARVEPKATVPQKAAENTAARRAQAEALAQEGHDLLNKNEGNAEAARAKFEEAVKLAPTYAEGYVGVGVTYYVRERYDEALDWYKKALDASPTLGDAYYNIGCIYALKGDVDQALRYLRIALLNGYVQLDALSADPDLKGLAGNERFERLKSGLTD